MKKAKTKKNLISILIAILGVVFAFITGVTYCISTFTLKYGMHPNSTSAYMANQQYHLINDTVDQPVIFGEGSRNFEIALQYSMPYDFDVRLEYTLTWSGGGSASNVILHFANRDNIIYDEKYIYLAESVSKGDGKIGIITGVDFTNTNDEAYYGQSLTIDITDVKIYKSQSESGSYALAGHLLTQDDQSSVAAQAWILYKNRTIDNANSYVMMYNSRGTHETGVPYPGLETAYKKPVAQNAVSGPSWLGGNRSYAGVGMYVITGDSTLEMNIEVAGIWRVKNTVCSNPDCNQVISPEYEECPVCHTEVTVTDASPQLISENSIKFNYTKDWTHVKWNDLKLWETRNYNFKIPAQTACYIDVLNSVEITSSSRVTSNLYDTYRAVINNIVINSNLGANSTKFEYTEADPHSVSMKQINNNSGLSTSGNYSKPNVSVVNTSVYSCGLYTAHVGDSTAEQFFKTNISLINNTNTTQNINVDFKLMCLMSNGSTVLTKEYDGVSKRADELIGTKPNDNEDFSTPFNAFNQNLYYAYELETETIDETTTKHAKTTINRTVSPYSSVSVLETFSAIEDLQDEIKNKFSPEDATHYFDVWVFLEVTISVGNFNDHTYETSKPADDSPLELNKTSLLIETDWNVDKTRVIFSVKNPSNKIVHGVFIKAFSGQELGAPDYTSVTTEPSDWTASYWKYYHDPYGHSSFTTSEFSTPVYKKEQGYSINHGLQEHITGSYNMTLSGTNFTSTNLVLQPGESATFASIDIQESDPNKIRKIYFSGEAYSELSKKVTDEIAYVNEGKTNAFIINNSENSYYVRFSGNLSETPSTIFTDGGYNYYIGIIRPGQILSLQTTTTGEFDAIKIEDDGVFDTDTLETWSEAAKQKMTRYFAFTKT